MSHPSDATDGAADFSTLILKLLMKHFSENRSLGSVILSVILLATLSTSNSLILAQVVEPIASDSADGSAEVDRESKSQSPPTQSSAGMNEIARQFGQQYFELNANKLGIKSTALLTANFLQIVAPDGQVSIYGREREFDSEDGQWLGYYSREVNQVLRWPISNSGNFKIGSRQGSSVTYRVSQMEIQPPASAATTVISDAAISDVSIPDPVMPSPAGSRTSLRPTVPPISPAAPQVGEILADLAVSKLFDVISRSGKDRTPSGELVRLVSVDSRGAPWMLARDRSYGLQAVSNTARGSDWWISPVGNGYVRVQSSSAGRVYALSAGRGNALALRPASQDPQQFWRVSGGRGGNRFVLENVAYAGSCLAHVGGGTMALQPMTYAPTQMWSPYIAPAAQTFQPFWKSVQTEVVPNSQLPPAKVDLVNSHKYALVIALGDIRRGNDFEQIRIEPGQSKTVELDRDAGATIVETVEVQSPLGGWKSQQYVTAIPPRALYDISVYEEHLQSIAIDATGTSPNRIEDVNYVPKSVGWLPLPAGQGIPARGRIDLYPKAKDQKNPGAVRRLDPEQFDDPPAERPLERIKRQLESSERRKF